MSYVFDRSRSIEVLYRKSNGAEYGKVGQGLVFEDERISSINEMFCLVFSVFNNF